MSVFTGETEQCRSSTLTCEEEAAHTLVMLSEDSWYPAAPQHYVEEEEDEYEEEEDDDEDDDEEEENAEPVVMATKKTDGKGKFVCSSCGKAFLTYQALGGHRANHKKIKTETMVDGVKDNHRSSKELAHSEQKVPENSKTHQCRLCLRAFASGQALGGHKRAHIMAGDYTPPPEVGHGTTTTLADLDVTVEVKQSLIDLNLPAPMEDEDRIEHCGDITT